MTAVVEKARELNASDNFDSVRRHYMRALALQPRNWDLMEEIGKALFAAGEVQAALDLADHALSINPIAASLWRLRGTVLLVHGLVQPALEAARCCVNLDPRDAAGHILLARVLLYQKQYPVSLHAIAIAIAIADAFAGDGQGAQSPQILGLQVEVLAAIARDQAHRATLAKNRYRRLDEIADL